MNENLDVRAMLELPFLKRMIWVLQLFNLIVGGLLIYLSSISASTPVKAALFFFGFRYRSGGEVPLKSYTKFHSDDERTRAIYQRMLAGVSCRNYRKTLEKMAKMAGVSKSVVSRKIVESTEADMKAFCERDLSGLDICVILIDGMPW